MNAKDKIRQEEPDAGSRPSSIEQRASSIEIRGVFVHWQGRRCLKVVALTVVAAFFGQGLIWADQVPYENINNTNSDYNNTNSGYEGNSVGGEYNNNNTSVSFNLPYQYNNFSLTPIKPILGGKFEPPIHRFQITIPKNFININNIVANNASLYPNRNSTVVGPKWITPPSHNSIGPTYNFDNSFSSKVTESGYNNSFPEVTNSVMSTTSPNPDNQIYYNEKQQPAMSSHSNSDYSAGNDGPLIHNYTIDEAGPKWITPASSNSIAPTYTFDNSFSSKVTDFEMTSWENFTTTVGIGFTDSERAREYEQCVDRPLTWAERPLFSSDHGKSIIAGGRDFGWTLTGYLTNDILHPYPWADKEKISELNKGMIGLDAEEKKTYIKAHAEEYREAEAISIFAPGVGEVLVDKLPESSTEVDYYPLGDLEQRNYRKTTDLLADVYLSLPLYPENASVSKEDAPKHQFGSRIGANFGTAGRISPTVFVTAEHCVHNVVGNLKLSPQFEGGRRSFKAWVVEKDAISDTAILRTYYPDHSNLYLQPGDVLPVIPIVSDDSLRPGTEVFRLWAADTHGVIPDGARPVWGVEPSDKNSRRIDIEDYLTEIGRIEFYPSLPGGPSRTILYKYGHIPNYSIKDCGFSDPVNKPGFIEKQQLVTISGFTGQSGSPVFTTTSTGEDVKLLLGGVASQSVAGMFDFGGREFFPQRMSSMPAAKYIRQLLNVSSAGFSLSDVSPSK